MTNLDCMRSEFKYNEIEMEKSARTRLEGLGRRLKVEVGKNEVSYYHVVFEANLT